MTPRIEWDDDDRDAAPLTVGEIVFMAKRLQRMREELLGRLYKEELTEEKGMALRILTRSLESIILFMKGKERGMTREDWEADLQILLVSENENGVNGAYLCDNYGAEVMNEALIETEHVVTAYNVIPQIDRPFYVTKPRRKPE